MIAPEWGWGTDDGAQALQMLARFGSVTVLNGHIHQLMQKVEGSVTFHTARSTAFPQPAPGTAPAPGPKLVPAGELRKYLGVAEVAYAPAAGPLAITDSALGDVRDGDESFALVGLLLAGDARASRAGAPTSYTARRSTRAARTATRSTRTTSVLAIEASSAERRAGADYDYSDGAARTRASSGTRRRSTNG